MTEEIKQGLRDAILLEADFLNTHALMLDKIAGDGAARAVLEQRLKSAAINCRQRAKMLNDVLAASRPTEAKAS